MLPVLWWPTAVRADDNALGAAVEAVRTRVVKLYGLKIGRIEQGYGSGILVSPDGQVLTVLSILLDSSRVRAVTHDGRRFEARVMHTDERRQLALLQLGAEVARGSFGADLPVEPTESTSFDFFEPGDSQSLRPGDWVVAAGNPFKVAEGAEPISVTLGVFSGRTRLDARRGTRPFPYHGEVLVIDAITSNPGAPGGALVDLEGHWAGMIGRVVTANATHTHFNYAMPIEELVRFLAEARDPHSPTAHQATAVAGYHGIRLFKQAYQRHLVLVDRVKRNSPAARAGVKADDLIISVNGRNVVDREQFERVSAELRPGDTMDLMVMRDDKLQKISFVLESTK